jgi:apolipoprotein N-acyltransferase
VPGHPDRLTFLTQARLALIFALLFLSAFPPLGIWWLGYWSLVPITLASWQTTKPWRTALLFTLTGTLVFAFFHRWLWDVTIPGYPIVSVMLGLYVGFYVLLIARAKKRNIPLWLAAPLCWVGLEFFRGNIAFGGYPWYLLGQTTMRTLAWERPSSIAYLGSFVGSYGLSLLVSTISLPLIIELTTTHRARKPWRGLVKSLVIVLVLSTIGAIFARPSSASNAPPAARVGIVQTNLPQDNKLGWKLEDRSNDFARFASMTRLFVLSAQPPDLIVWPETMYPGLALNDQTIDALNIVPPEFVGLHALGANMRRNIEQLQQELGIPLLIGAESYDDFKVNINAFDDQTLELFTWGARYNSVQLLNNGAVQQQRYNKLHLTPFGEVMPYISKWEWLEQKLLDVGAQGMSFDLDAGDGPVAFEIPTARGGVRVAPLVCFEATMPQIARIQTIQNGQRRADILLHMTNDGWFGKYAGGREMHALIARARSIELGTPIVRVANTGISCAFDDIGKRLPLKVVMLDNSDAQELRYVPANTEAVVTVDVPQAHHLTLASRIGESFGWLALLGLVGCVVARRSRPMQQTAQSTSESKP